MRKILAFLVFVTLGSFLAAQEVVKAPVTFVWDASTDPALGYRLYIDGGTPTQWLTTQTDPIPLLPGAHTATVSAYNSMLEGAKSAPIAFVVQAPTDPTCVLPLGNRAISIFVTNLQKTGSGGALSRARLDFQLASPNSPVTHVAVRTNGGDLSFMNGSSLESLAGLWFTVPAVSGTYKLSVLAANEYGCTNEVPTTKSVVVP